MNQNEYPIDVREIPPKQKNPTIFHAWKELKKGDVLVLINDHDPLPLYYQFASEHAGEFFWEYEREGPEVWRVRVMKGEFGHPGFTPRQRKSSGLSPVGVAHEVVMDMRPMFAEDEAPFMVIEDAAANLLPGQALVLLVPFEPESLNEKLEQEGFLRETRQLEDGSWRIEFRKSFGRGVEPPSLRWG